MTVNCLYLLCIQPPFIIQANEKGGHLLKRKLLPILFVILVLAACGNQEAENHTENPDLLQVENEGNSQNREHTDQEAAERLTELATRVPNVNNASAVVFGNYTIIGLDIDDNLDRSQSGSVKHAVTEIIKHDPYGHYAYVLADPDIMARIDEINESIQSGESPGVILEELANIVGRAIPDMPMRETRPENEQNSVPQNDEDIEQERQNQTDHPL